MTQRSSTFHKNDIWGSYNWEKPIYDSGTCKTARPCSNPSYYPNLLNGDDNDDEENGDGFNYDKEYGNDIDDVDGI